MFSAETIYSECPSINDAAYSDRQTRLLGVRETYGIMKSKRSRRRMYRHFPRQFCARRIITVHERPDRLGRKYGRTICVSNAPISGVNSSKTVRNRSPVTRFSNDGIINAEFFSRLLGLTITRWFLCVFFRYSKSPLRVLNIRRIKCFVGSTYEKPAHVIRYARKFPNDRNTHAVVETTLSSPGRRYLIKAPWSNSETYARISKKGAA